MLFGKKRSLRIWNFEPYVTIWKRAKRTFLSQSCVLLNATKFWDGIKNLRDLFVDKIQEQENKK